MATSYAGDTVAKYTTKPNTSKEWSWQVPAQSKDTSGADTSGGLLDTTTWDTNLKPYSTSSSENNSASGSSSWSGLPAWSSQAIQPVFNQNLSKAWEGAGGLLNSYLSPESFQERFKPTADQITNDLNARGLVGGTEMAKQLADSMAEQYAKEQATGLAAYQSMINSLNSILESSRQSTSSSSSAGGGKSQSYQEDPTQMYQIIANLIPQLFS